MGLFGKIVGGTIGFALGGPLGAIAGAALGHALDSDQQQYHGLGQLRLSTGEEAQLTFFVAAFSMLAKLVKADGRILKEEIDAVENFMAYDLSLDPESRRIAGNIFNAALESQESFNNFAVQFYNQFQAQYQMLDLMIDILIRVSVADGTISTNEEKLILTAVKIFNFSDEKYRQLKSRYVKDLDKYYAILESNPKDSNEHVKKQFRKLVSDYHPDKIASKGLPEEFTKFANDKFREIKEAYEVVKQERKIT
ncbi:MAG: TerB family tellurite resistance protein [Desulfobacterales bacterium]|uniref:TerB family tellurite resistance protein n=1 Tax=Candidatus Desulfatibia vada TaxID=2841696 RepID=A0A8J6TKS1_9BACT|nr:TerB family tellurite resistance protein [Candidatus Desulfatibia vada]